MRTMADDLTTILHAARPHPSLGDDAWLFDRFVGTWDTDYTHFGTDGAVSERFAGEVIFGWILDGRAMQDVWIAYPRGERKERSIGTSIRFFDANAGLWNVIWISPEGSIVTTVRGGAVGDRIVLEGENLDGSRRRWSFNDIGPDSFTWRGEGSTDQGTTWHASAEYHMTRRSGTPR